MKLIILATGIAPDHYSVNGETLTVHDGGVSESFDLSAFPDGGVFEGVVADTVETHGIRNVERVNGELTVTVSQQVGPGHWSASDPIDATAYDPDAIMVKRDASRAHAGKAWAKTRRGRVFVGE